LALPQALLISSCAEHCCVCPQFRPVQVQLQGPVPLTADAVPLLHRLAVGALVRFWPFAWPQLPSAFCAKSAEQDCVLPPLLPAQDHVQGPEPLVVEAVPAVQSPVVGALVNCDPFDVPHAPFTGGNTSEAEQLAVPPPLLPAHDQFHGPLPVTDEAVPAVQRPVAGALVRSVPLEAPQLALTSSNAEHDAVVPPLLPVQLQSQGPLPLNDETEPVLQRPVVGALVRSAPFDAPQLPLTAAPTEAASRWMPVVKSSTNTR
jgi:hypothetical protein